MNAGFCMLEAGMCRQKNATNVLAKNLIVFALSTVAFWAIGFGLMFSDGNGLIGSSGGFFLTGADNSPATGTDYKGIFGALNWTGVPLAANAYDGRRRRTDGGDFPRPASGTQTRRSANAMPGHNMAIATLGCLILWLGWFGFNPGSTMSVINEDEEFVGLDMSEHGMEAYPGLVKAAMTPAGAMGYEKSGFMQYK